MARWESGEYSPQPWLRPKIAKAFGLSLRELAGCDQAPQLPVVEPEHDQLSREVELVRAYAGAEAPRTTTGLPQVPWNTYQLAVSTAHAILTSFIKATGAERVEGSAEPLASFTLLSSITQIILTYREPSGTASITAMGSNYICCGSRERLEYRRTRAHGQSHCSAPLGGRPSH